MSEARWCDGSGAGFGWIAPEPRWMGRTSHALAAGGGVWLVDPVDVPGLDERLAPLGEPRAVLQLLDRHRRDCAALAERLRVPLLVLPREIPDSPFETVRTVDAPWWHETALWWPERRTLLVAEAVGTLRHFCAPGRPLGVHPLLRLTPPRTLLHFAPEHVLVGHGGGVHDAPAAALDDAVRSARRELRRVLPRLAAAMLHPAY